MTTKGKLLTAAAPAAASEEFFKNERRDRAGELSIEAIGVFMVQEFGVMGEWRATKNTNEMRRGCDSRRVRIHNVLGAKFHEDNYDADRSEAKAVLKTRAVQTFHDIERRR